MKYVALVLAMMAVPVWAEALSPAELQERFAKAEETIEQALMREKVAKDELAMAEAKAKKAEDELTASKKQVADLQKQLATRPSPTPVVATSTPTTPKTTPPTTATSTPDKAKERRDSIVAIQAEIKWWMQFDKACIVGIESRDRDVQIRAKGGRKEAAREIASLRAKLKMITAPEAETTPRPAPTPVAPAPTPVVASSPSKPTPPGKPSNGDAILIEQIDENIWKCQGTISGLESSERSFYAKGNTEMAEVFRSGIQFERHNLDVLKARRAKVAAGGR